MHAVDAITVMDHVVGFTARDFRHPLVPKLAPQTPDLALEVRQEILAALAALLAIQDEVNAGRGEHHPVDFLNAEEVLDQAASAKRMPAREAAYRNLVLNQRVEARSPFISRSIWTENGAPPEGKWADIALLEPVRDYKARHASTMLTFDAVVDAIGQIEDKRRPAAG